MTHTSTTAMLHIYFLFRILEFCPSFVITQMTLHTVVGQAVESLYEVMD